ncbi:MAG: exodeoxyribonuclease VII large subunit [Prevotellaceae bacterium]|jgi:exodeoxyribonuclease VII large subunit|nr:exodeoxyribonuclease VII large subunit [Prevotellaceae bacterium]
MSNISGISLLQLQQIIKREISDNLDAFYWIVAEINEFKINSNGHCYLELVEKDKNSDFIKAKISATIWASTMRMLKPYFETTTGVEFDEGLNVLVKAQVQYHELYGLALNIVDIEPSYTIGEIEMKRRQVIEQLKNEGVFDMNRELEFPVFPSRVAVISSSKAAGYRDFMQHLNNNAYGYIFKTELFEAAMQGAAAESSIIAAFDEIYKRANEFDVVAIIRGGGSQSDLSCFDAHDLVYCASQFPLPYLTGIGHDKDVSILDMTANKMLKTPTAVADFLLTCFIELERYIDSLSNRLKKLAALDTEKDYLNSLINTLQTNLFKRLYEEKVKVNKWLPQKLDSVAKSLISKHLYNINLLESKVNVFNPENILKQGYSLTLHNGKRITSPLSSGTAIETVFHWGRLKSLVIDSEKPVQRKKRPKITNNQQLLIF